MSWSTKRAYLRLFTEQKNSGSKGLTTRGTLSGDIECSPRVLGWEKY